MNILVVSQVYYPESFSINLICEELTKKGHRVTVLTGIPNYGKTTYYDGYTKKPHDEVINGVNILRCKISPRTKGVLSLLKNYWSFYRSSMKRAKKIREHFDVVFSFCLSPITGVCAANYIGKKRKIHHTHYCMDVWPESVVETGYVKKNSFIYKRLFNFSKSIYSKMDRIIVSSPSFKDYFVSEMQIQSEKLIYIPQPAQKEQAVINPIKYQAKYNFLFAGNIGKVQLVDKLINAFSLLPPNIDARLHILGNGSEYSRIHEIVKEKQMDNKVALYGRVNSEEVPNYFANATALLLILKNGTTVVSSTIPYKMINYMKAKKPILGFLNGDGLSILQQTQKNLFVYPRTDEETILKGLTEIILFDQNKLNDIAQNNYDYYLTNFEIGKILNQIEAVLEETKSKKATF